MPEIQPLKDYSDPHFIPDVHTHHLTQNSHAIYSIRLRNDAPSVPEKYWAPLSPPLFSVGIHPWDIEGPVSPELWQKLEVYIAHPRCKAIGECGLDRLKGNFELQQTYLPAFFQLSAQFRKPLVIHLVRAWEAWFSARAQAPKGVTCVLHGFNGKKELAARVISAGDYISFGAHWRSHPDFSKFVSGLPKEAWFLESDEADPAIVPLLFMQASEGLRREDIKERLLGRFSKVFLGK